MQGENQSAIGQFSEVSSVGGRRRKVPGKATYIVCSLIGVDVCVRDSHLTAVDVHSSPLPKKQSGSVPGSFFRRGRRRKVPGKFKKRALTSC